jgi:hypothetical protein
MNECKIERQISRIYTHNFAWCVYVTYVYINVRIYEYVCIYMHAFLCACMYAYMYAGIYARTYVYTNRMILL